PERETQSAAFSPDGRVLAAGSHETIWLWEVTSGREIRRLQGHKGRVNDLTFSPDGRTLASAGQDWSVGLWDVGSGERIRTLMGKTLVVNAGNQADVNAVAFSPD